MFDLFFNAASNGGGLFRTQRASPGMRLTQLWHLVLIASVSVPGADGPTETRYCLVPRPREGSATIRRRCSINLHDVQPSHRIPKDFGAWSTN